MFQRRTSEIDRVLDVLARRSPDEIMRSLRQVHQDWRDQHGPPMPGSEGPFEDQADWGGPQGVGRGFVVPGGDSGFSDIPAEGRTVNRDRGGRECVTCPGGVERFSSAVSDFLAEQNTSDAQELLIRAQRHAETQTSTWSRQASRDAVKAFMATVEYQIASRPTTSPVFSKSAAAVNDFDDQLMFT